MLRLTFLAALLTLSPSLRAERVHNPYALLKTEGCVAGGGVYLWDSKRCLFENDAIWLSGTLVPLKETKRIALRRQRGGNTETIGDIDRILYEGQGVVVRLDLQLLRGCDYSKENCTYRNYLAGFVVRFASGSQLTFQGVGYGGS
jgi:hypothetical protein